MSPQFNPIDYDEAWKKLNVILERILSGNKLEKDQWNYIFRLIGELTHSYPGDLYNSAKHFFMNHISRKFDNLTQAEDLLSSYNESWKEFNQGADYVHDLFEYFNTEYVKIQKTNEEATTNSGSLFERTMQIGELALAAWKQYMIKPMEQRLVQKVLEEVDRDRKKNPTSVNPEIIKVAILSFIDVEKFNFINPFKYYEQVIERNILEMTSQHYLQEAQKCINQYDCRDYVLKALQYITDEKLVCLKYLNANSAEKVVTECKHRLIKDHLEYLHSECHNVMHKECREDMKNLYRLLSQFQNGFTIFLEEIERDIKKTCAQAVQMLKVDNNSEKFVESLICVHKKYRDLILNVFNSDPQFIVALDKACVGEFNVKPNTKNGISHFAVLLAKYFDSLLKSGKAMTEAETDDKLNSSIIIFKYLADKDLFRMFYSKFLAKRLISGHSQCMDKEESLINRLREICGYEYTKKLQAMFSDMNINVDLNNKFSEYLKEGPASVDLGVKFSVLVLKSGAWPLTQGNLPSFSIPQELEQCVQTFESYYLGNHTGRRLYWIHSFCQCEIKMFYPKNTFFATMSTFTAAILLQFNTAEKFSLQDLQEATLLPLAELQRQIKMLIDGKFVCEEASLAMTFRLNTEYNNKRLRFKIKAPQKDAVQESEENLASIIEDRQIYLQATIVRILKDRKTLKHNLLIKEVTSQAKGRFAPNMSQIKKCIDTLIDKQFIERKEGSLDEYAYVA